MKIPCEDCITVAICKQIILNDLELPITNLRYKCSLFRKFTNFYNYKDIYTVIERVFKLNFKIKQKQKLFM